MIDPSIAIIIPVYNVEKYLEETLLSVEKQTSMPDEIIIIDDGSTDNSFNILKKFEKLANLKIIRTHNQGLGPARNLGRSISNSEYIYFLDSDDLIKKDLIFKIRSVINDFNKPDMILFSGDTFSEFEHSKKKTNLKFTLTGSFKQDSGLITQLIKKKEALPQAGRYVTKSSLWSENKINYPASIFEDEAVFFPLLALSKNTIVLSEIYFMYRKGRLGSITNSLLGAKHASSYFHVISIFIDFMDKYPYLIKKDLSAWRFRLGRIGLNYISMCIKTKSPINWRTIYLLIFKIKSFVYPYKLLWRFIKGFKLN